MRCPYCQYADSKVVDSRATEEGNSIRRRRECPNCMRRFTTYEVIEKIPLMVVKKDGRREIFDRTKLMNGLLKSFEKRPISVNDVEQLVSKIESELRNAADAEVTTTQIGEITMKYLREVDQVAYVRFASVYRQFADINNFLQELEKLVNHSRSGRTK